MTEDSQRAMKEIKEYDGHRISVCVAKKKLQEQKKTGENKVSFLQIGPPCLHDNLDIDDVACCSYSS